MLLLAAAAVVALLAFRGSSSTSALQAAGCTLQNVPVMMKNAKPWQEHVGDGSPIKTYPKGFEYSTFPPTSGPHYPIPAPWNVYDDPVDEHILVHNLEHGGVVVQYGKDVSQEDLNSLLDWYRKDPNGIVIAPLPALGNTIALAAWSADTNLKAGKVSNQRAHLAKCPGFDEKAVDSFANTYGFRGPEYHPRAVLTPST